MCTCCVPGSRMNPRDTKLNKTWSSGRSEQIVATAIQWNESCDTHKYSRNAQRTVGSFQKPAVTVRAERRLCHQDAERE